MARTSSLRLLKISYLNPSEACAISFHVPASPADLLQQLGVDGIAPAGLLRSRLDVSPQTLGRLVEAAGEEVVRIGRTRATQYARTRAVEGLGRQVPVVQVDGRGAVVPRGRLHFLWGRRTWWERESAEQSQVFDGLPPALADMTPQGFLGRAFAQRHAAELRLPLRVDDWSTDHCLIALARRGEDCVGDLIVGEESLQRHPARRPEEVSPAQYPALAERSAAGDVGSSAGGERPKFGALSGGRQVLVKFASDAPTPAARRWRDLLWCEWMALETIREAGVEAASARWLDVAGWRFLEVERFDRVGARGRRAVLSLLALAHQDLGHIDTWTSAAGPLQRRPFLLPAADARRLRWLDVFGQLVGNTDRHFGNVSFLVDDSGRLRLAPAYDTLPMVLAPAGDEVPARSLAPSPPTATNLEVWPDAARWAVRYWQAVRSHRALEPAVRDFAEGALRAIEGLAERVAPSG